MTQQEVVKSVLDEFFNVRREVSESFDESFVSLTLDTTDTEILSEAVVQALEKQHENQNQ